MGLIHDIIIAKEIGGKTACIIEYRKAEFADKKAEAERHLKLTRNTKNFRLIK